MARCGRACGWGDGMGWPTSAQRGGLRPMSEGGMNSTIEIHPASIYLRKAANSSGVTVLTARNPTSDEKHASVLPVCCPVRNVARAKSAVDLKLPPLTTRLASPPELAA